MIFLSIASGKNNIYLLREENYLNNKKGGSDLDEVGEKMNYVVIDQVKINTFNHINKNNNFAKENIDNILNDIVSICYFLGNDFLPHIPSIDINIGGLDILIESYIYTYSVLKTTLITVNPKLELNVNFLCIFLEFISKKENYYFSNILKKHKERVESRTCRHTDPYKIEMWELENMKNTKLMNIKNPINFTQKDTLDCKFSYYKHYFKTCYDKKKFINNICKHYLKGVMWTLNYYFKGCVSWSWSYPFTHAPFISDICEFIMKTNTNLNTIDFGEDSILTPCEQLLAVLPPKCVDIIPKSYNNLVSSNDSPIIDLYPIKISLDMIEKDKYWKCLPLIPSVNVKRIKNATCKLKLTEKENDRNMVLDEIRNFAD